MQNLRNAKFGIPAFFALFLCAFAALRESIFLRRFPPDEGEDRSDLALEAADQFVVGGDQRLLALQAAHLVAPTPPKQGQDQAQLPNFPKPPRHPDGPRRSQRLAIIRFHSPDGNPTSKSQNPANHRQDPVRSLGRTDPQTHRPPESRTRLHLAESTILAAGDTQGFIEFDGKDYEIAPVSRKVVTVLFHPFRKLWVLDHSPNLTWPSILGHFTLKSV